MAAHRYWRLFILATANTSGSVEVAELQFREVAGVNQVPSGGTAIRSSVGSSSATYQASNAFDGDNTTRWRSDTPWNEWIGYDFGPGNSIEPVEILLGAYTSLPTYNPRICCVEYSDNGTDWSLYSWVPEQTGWSTGQNRVIALSTGPAETRITQTITYLVDLPEPPARFTQIGLYAITLPVQPARFTQVPITTVYTPRPVPEPTPLVPLAPVGEEFVFLTAVNRTRSSKEQRVRLTENPRHRYAYTVQLTTDEQRQRAYAYLYKNQNRELIHPMFHHWTRLLAETAPLSDRLYFDPAGTDLRVGEALAIFDVYTMEVTFHTVAELFSDGARCEEPIGRQVGEVHAVCPAPMSRFIRVPDLTMAEGLGEARVTIETTRDRTLQRVDDFVLPMLGDLPVLAVEPFGAANEILERGTEWLDTGLSVPSPRTKWRYGLMSGSREYRFDRETDFDFWRAMLDHLGGRQRTIRVPTFFNDLPLAQQPALGATELVTSNIQAFEYLMAGSYGAITIWRDTGTLHRTVLETKMVYNAEGDPVAVRMLLDGSIGSGPGSNVIKAISYLNRMRMGSDSVVLSHHQNYSTITLELQAVNQ